MITSIDTIYETYCFYCKVGAEEEKLFYYNKFNDLITSVSDNTQNWNYARLKFEIFTQHLVKNRKGEPIRVTYKNYPTGGFKKINSKNIEKLTLNPFQNIEHLKFKFENFHGDDTRFHPLDNSGLIHFHQGTIIASIANKESTNEFMDLYIYFGDTNRTSQDSNNQYCELILRPDAFDEKAKQNLIKEISQLSCANEVYSNFRPFRKVWVDNSGITCFNEVLGDTYKLRKADNTNQFGNIWKKLLVTNC